MARGRPWHLGVAGLLVLLVFSGCTDAPPDQVKAAPAVAEEPRCDEELQHHEVIRPAAGAFEHVGEIVVPPAAEGINAGIVLRQSHALHELQVRVFDANGSAIAEVDLDFEPKVVVLGQAEAGAWTPVEAPPGRYSVTVTGTGYAAQLAVQLGLVCPTSTQ